GETVIDLARLREAGERAKVCPYELALRYAEYADIVICDYNYLFHPRVALRRFFSDKGDWCFLCDEAHNLIDRARELYSVDLPLTFFDAFAPAAEQNPALKTALDRTRSRLRAILAPLVADTVETDGEGIKRGFYRQSALPEGLLDGAAELLDVCLSVLEERKLPPELLAGLRDATYDLSEIVGKLANYSPRFVSFVASFGDALTYRALCLDPSEIIASRLSLGRSAVLFSATMTPTAYYRNVLGGKPTDDELDLPSPFDPAELCVAVLDKIGTRYSEREDTLRAVARAVLTTVKAKPGNYLVFCPSFAYLERLSEEVRRMAPGLETVAQSRRMDRSEREAFLDRFSEGNRRALVGFTVMGGIYAEGIDLVGRRLIGAVVVGVGLPQPTPENEAIREYYDDVLEEGREYAYIYPGMNRVLQAAGRVIRREEDRGVVVLIDDRFSDPVYRRLMPNHWRGLKYVGDLSSLSHLLGRFWGGVEKAPSD
ncbi:MAG: ATP-dependent DNA helicase, partial [Clostridia bacterium]|nr:ATP-dependent DNA helicase [Clostridia bacterium]